MTIIMDKGPMRRVARGDGTKGEDKCAAAVDFGDSELRKKCKTTAMTAVSSSLHLLSRPTKAFVTLPLVALVCWILLSTTLFSGSASRLASSSQRLMQALHPATEDELPYYTPTLYSDDNNNKEKYKKEDFPWPTIHILISPFMQRQPNLTALGHARIALFDAFCLPTVQHQTSQQFLWIMKTDPNLDPGILKKMVQLLKPFPNAFLVGSNGDDLKLFWRNGSQGKDLANSRVYTGNRTLLEMAMAFSTQLPVLETRLDADDGLNIKYMETIQKVASEQVFSPPSPLPEGEKEQQPQSRLRWKHWCADRNVNWHSSIIPPVARNSNNKTSTMLYGKIIGPVHDPWCITPGLTTAYAVGTTIEQVTIYNHHKLRSNFRKIPLSPEQSCGLSNSTECLDDLVGLHPFEAIRARTPTSAGMKDIELGTTEEEDKEKDDAMWDDLHTHFRIPREKVQFVQEYFTENVVAIAKDNLVGQCPDGFIGFSCKKSSKAQLQELIATYSA